ncbi:MAG: hypothetical protein RLZZ385_1031 [Pseudomonadota bacterium]|jgi:DNA-binding winged helix-turn-helix (wHTH) protein
MHTAQRNPAPLHNPLDQDFCLGEWLVQPSLNALQHRQQPRLQRGLEPRLMHLLCYLAANPQRVMSREDLNRELWPRVIVNENSLTRAVSELRKQLATPEHAGQHWIQTISKRGYRLNANVQMPAPHVTAVSPLTREARFTPEPHWLRSGMMSPLGWLAGASLVLTLAFTAWMPAAPPGLPLASQDDMLYDRVINDDSGPASGHILTLSGLNQPVSSYTPVLSPDGGAIAFVRYDSMGSTVYLGSVDALEAPIPLYTTRDHLSRLSWSPVGNALLFARRPYAQGASLMGSPPAADLMMLDLDSLEVRVLLEQAPVSPVASGKSNLT